MTLLYHYCTVEAFYAIATSRTVRLSSVRHSNDGTEGALVRNAVERHARRAGLDEPQVLRLQRHAHELESQFDGMAFCLSEEGDQLSQWRGYANDGRGVAIGLRKDALEELSRRSEEMDDGLDIRLYKAVYDELGHDASTRELFDYLREFDAEGTNVAGDDSRRAQELRQRLNALHQLRLSLAAYDAIYSLKHPAFSGEREWRLLHHFDWDHSVPDGFRAATSRIAPFVNLELFKSSPELVVEVVLGPRHSTPEGVVKHFLQQHGYTSTAVRKSDAPYRRDA